MYTIIWRFTVRPGFTADFERHYASGGTWARLFRRYPGYLGTDLLRDTAAPNVYITIDRWTSPDAFAAARGPEYAALDETCAGLTEREEKLGAIDS